MVEFYIVGALIAGFVGTVVMSLLMNASKAADLADIPRMPLVMGSMVSGERKTAMGIGAVLHFIVMGNAVLGLVVALVYQWVTGS